MNVIPQNIDAEEFVLGCCMLDSTALAHSADGLRVVDFHRPQHRVIFQQIKEMFEHGLEVDEFTLQEALKAGGKLGEAGGPAMVLTLAQRVPAVVNHKAYVAEVRKASIRRSVAELGTGLTSEAVKDDGDAEAAVDAAERTVCDLRDVITGKKIRNTDAAIDEMLNDLFFGGELDTVPFPIDALNTMAGGQQPGEVVVTGGMSGDGKSWWGLDCAERAVLRGHRTAYYSLEMPAKQCVARLTAMGGHSLTDIRKRKINTNDIAPRIDALRDMAKRLDIIDGATSVGRVVADLMRARMSGKPYRYVVVDHLHLLDLPDAQRAGEYRIALNNALTRFKRAAVEHECTIHLLAQLKRPSERKIEAPRLADLKESSAIEQIGDYVLFVYRDRNDAGHVQKSGKVIVAKARDGDGIGQVEVLFDTSNFRFRPIPAVSYAPRVVA